MSISLIYGTAEEKLEFAVVIISTYSSYKYSRACSDGYILYLILDVWYLVLPDIPTLLPVQPPRTSSKEREILFIREIDKLTYYLKLTYVTLLLLPLGFIAFTAKYHLIGLSPIAICLTKERKVKLASFFA